MSCCRLHQWRFRHIFTSLRRFYQIHPFCRGKFSYVVVWFSAMTWGNPPWRCHDQRRPDNIHILHKWGHICENQIQDGVTSGWFEYNLMQILILSKINYLLTYGRVSPTRFETNFTPIYIGGCWSHQREVFGNCWGFWRLQIPVR